MYQLQIESTMPKLSLIRKELEAKQITEIELVTNKTNLPRAESIKDYLSEFEIDAEIIVDGSKRSASFFDEGKLLSAGMSPGDAKLVSATCERLWKEFQEVKKVCAKYRLPAGMYIGNKQIPAKK